MDTHRSSTIEMCDLSNEYECAVIDEIQMLEDDSRGHSWTAALLGIIAPEIHICGDERAIGLV